MGHRIKYLLLLLLLPVLSFGQLTQANVQDTINLYIKSPLGVTPVKKTFTTLNQYAALKQATLVSALNIKTINGVTLLGSGDLTLTIPSNSDYVDKSTNQTGIAGNKTYIGVPTFSPSVTTASSIARGSLFNPALTTSANNDVLVAVDIAPTFSNIGGFTGVTNVALRVQGNILPTPNNTNSIGSYSLYYANMFTNTSNLVNIRAIDGSGIVFRNSAGLQYGLLSSTGSWILQNGGAFSSNGSALQVNVGTVATTGSVPLATFTAGAHTNQTATTELVDIDFNLNRTIQFATGAKTDQRAFRIQAPTYSAIASSTTTNAATVAITGAPIAGTNMTITNSLALWVQGGSTKLAGKLNLGTTTDYADNAAALSGGLVVGDVYRTGDNLKIVH